MTLVMNVDLGGWLRRGSLALRAARPLGDALLRAWLEHMLLSVVMLRDKVGLLALHAALCCAACWAALWCSSARRWLGGLLGNCVSSTARCLNACYPALRRPAPARLPFPSAAGGAEPVCGAALFHGGRAG